MTATSGQPADDQPATDGGEREHLRDPEAHPPSDVTRLAVARDTWLRVGETPGATYPAAGCRPRRILL
jgi:hypothetical protein